MNNLDQQKILIVDDSIETLDLLKNQLTDSYAIFTASDIKSAKELMEKNTFHIAIIDLILAGENGVELIQEIKQRHPFTAIIAMSGQATIENAVTAMKLGADEFIVKPIRNLDLVNLQVEKLLQTQWLLEENQRLNELIQRDLETGIIVGNSPAIQSILQKVQKIAKLDTLVLITGETGVGKSVFAELIHRNSRRKHKRFVSVNCGSLTETLLESLLYGHKKGAFTDAWRDKMGYFQEANEGTLFLDEITETSLSFQVKLLKVLETGIFRQVGGDHDLHSNVRIITATNKDIKDMVSQNLFREDLYYRLNVITVHIPPLRERKDDIRLLSNAIVKEFCHKYGKQELTISPAVMNVLLCCQWKGNVRELRNAIEHAVILAEHSIMQLEDLPETIQPSSAQSPVPDLTDLKWGEAKETFERQYISTLLHQTGGNLSKAASRSGIPRENIYQKCRNLKLNPNDYRNKKSKNEA